MEKLHQLQEQMLKDSIREQERSVKRENANPEYHLVLIFPSSLWLGRYLKNIIVKYIEFEDQQDVCFSYRSTVTLTFFLYIRNYFQ